MSDSDECSSPKRQKYGYFLPIEEFDIKTEPDEVSIDKMEPDDVSIDKKEPDDVSIDKMEPDDVSIDKKEPDDVSIDTTEPTDDEFSNCFFFDDNDDDSKEGDEKETITLESFNTPGPSSSSTDTKAIENSTAKPSTSSDQQWSASCVMKNIPFNKKNGFLGNVGLKPIDFFNFFFEEELLSFICEQTNIEALKQIHLTTSQVGKVSWKDLTVPELRIVIGVFFHMGTLPLPRVHDYWRTDRLFSIPIFRESISRNRFMLIMKYLQFNVENKSVNDPVFRLRYLIDYFNNKMESCYYPGKELTIDESMYIWHGRLRPKSYVMNKLSCGIEISTLTEPDGLVLKLVAHNLTVNNPKIGHAEGIVTELLKNKLNCGHSLYMDISYNSIGLAKKLLEKNTYCTGELSKDMTDIPANVLEETVKYKKNNATCADGIVIGKWKQPPNINMIYFSTEFPYDMVPVGRCKRQTIYRPIPVIKIKHFKSAVERHEQILAFYPCSKIELPWLLKLALHTFQLLLVNSHHIYNKVNKNEKKMLFYDYRLEVINELLHYKNAYRINDDGLPEVSAPHKISKITERNKSGVLKRKSCRLCSKLHKRKDSQYHCLMCNNHPGLCFECFYDWHRLQFNK